MKNKMYLGMSGGVDSSTAAFISKNNGYDVTGVTHICCDIQRSDAEDASALCRELSIPHVTRELTDIFKKEVMEYFVDSYVNGRTPNPCVMCNRTVKFPYLADMAENGDVIATGHYARIGKCGDRFVIKKGADIKKDQSYMLWGLSQDILSKVVFPIGDLTKDEIRDIAKENSLPCAQKKDSQDICFIPDGDYAAFLKEFGNVKFVSGDYLDKNGRVLGKHTGHMNYTIGQRRGLGIALGKYMYVLSKNAANNTVILGDKEDLFASAVVAHSINLIATDRLEKGERLAAKIRYGKKEEAAFITQTAEDELTCVFDEPVSGPASGQSLVIYDGDTVVGGGIID